MRLRQVLVGVRQDELSFVAEFALVKHNEAGRFVTKMERPLMRAPLNPPPCEAVQPFSLQLGGREVSVRCGKFKHEVNTPTASGPVTHLQVVDDQRGRRFSCVC